jgi:glycosyltransferase involved in cell wall biosynthesis
VPELRHIIGAYADVDGFDVVHDHTIIGPFYAAVSGVDPLVVTTNHGPFNPELSDIYRRIGHRVPIIAISRHQASTARGVPIAGVIHHGVDPDTFPVGDGSGGYLLFLGRMVPEKGVHRAASIAREAGVPLLIAAKMREAAERAFFEAEVEPLLSHDIRYVGEVDDTERLKLLRGARALLNPIRWPEPFGLVMIEALACGTPVLAFAEGAAPEIVDHGTTGFLCADAEDMVRAVARVDLIDRRMCRAVAETRFSTSRMVSEHLHLFERLLASRSRVDGATVRGVGIDAHLPALNPVASGNLAEPNGLGHPVAAGGGPGLHDGERPGLPGFGNQFGAAIEPLDLPVVALDAGGQAAIAQRDARQLEPAHALGKNRRAPDAASG